MPLPAAPDWLTHRDGGLKPGTRDHILFVVLAGTPQYRLEAHPAKGTTTCQVTQTNNGRRLDGGKQYADTATALTGGLDELRETLGW